MKARAARSPWGLALLTAAAVAAAGAFAAPAAIWPQPVASANKALPDAGPELAVDGKTDTAWKSPPGAALWQVDLGAVRAFSGLVLRWAPPLRPVDYDVEASDNGQRWTQLRHVRDGEGAADFLYLPGAKARHLRLRIPRSAAKGVALQELQLVAAGQWKTRDDRLKTAAAEAPRGQYPRTYLGEQNYWTLVGVDGGGGRSGLVSEDGAVEAGLGGFSLEPTLRLDGDTLLNWANVATRHSLREGYLPMPSVFWQHPKADLRVEAAADGTALAPRLLVRYTVTAPAGQPLKGQLVLGLRPWQVNPPQQRSGTPGGAVDVRELAWKEGILAVNGRPALQTLPAPSQVELRGLDSDLAQGAADDRSAAVRDRQAMASAALSFALDLRPGGSQSVVVELPLTPTDTALQPLNAAQAAARYEAVAHSWRERLNHVQLTLPSSANHLSDRIRSALAHILMSRDGPALQTGTRSGQRGATGDSVAMVEGLLRMGQAQVATEFVNSAGDPLVANGQFIHAVALAWQLTGDQALLAEQWPRVLATTRAMAQQQQRERSDTSPLKRADPDALRALRSYKEAALLAQAGEHSDEATQITAWRDALQADLLQAVPLHAGGQEPAPRLDEPDELDALAATAPQDGQRDWQHLRPEVLRSVGALLRLGQAQRAWATLDFGFTGQRPEGWNQWAEWVMPDPRAVHELGDMPHAGVSANFLLGALDLLAYERERDQTLVLGAGLKPEWLAHASGVGMKGLRTSLGVLDWSLQPHGDGWQLAIGNGLRAPAGGFRLVWPAGLPLPDVALPDGRQLAWQDRELHLPGDVRLVQLRASAANKP